MKAPVRTSRALCLLLASALTMSACAPVAIGVGTTMAITGGYALGAAECRQGVGGERDCLEYAFGGALVVIGLATAISGALAFDANPRD